MCYDEVRLCVCIYISNILGSVIKMIEMAYVITQIEIGFDKIDQLRCRGHFQLHLASTLSKALSVGRVTHTSKDWKADVLIGLQNVFGAEVPNFT